MQPYLIYTIFVFIVASLIAAVKVDFADLQSQTWLPGGLIRFRFRPQEQLPASYKVSIDAPMHSKRPLQNPSISDIGQGWYQMEATIPTDTPNSNDWSIVFEDNGVFVNDLAKSQNFSISKNGASAPALSAAVPLQIPADMNAMASVPTIPPPPPPAETLVTNQPLQQTDIPFWMQQPTPILPNPMDQSSIAQTQALPPSQTQIPASIDPVPTNPLPTAPAENTFTVNPVTLPPLNIAFTAVPSPAVSMAPMDLTVNPVSQSLVPAFTPDTYIQTTIMPNLNVQQQAQTAVAISLPTVTAPVDTAAPVQTFIYVVPPPEQAQKALPPPPSMSAAPQSTPQAAQQQSPVYIVVPNPGTIAPTMSPTAPDTNSNIYDYTGGKTFE